MLNYITRLLIMLLIALIATVVITVLRKVIPNIMNIFTIELFLHETGHALSMLILSLLYGSRVPEIYVLYADTKAFGMTCSEYLRTLANNEDYRKIRIIAKSGRNFPCLLTVLLILAYAPVSCLLGACFLADTTVTLFMIISINENIAYIYGKGSDNGNYVTDYSIARHPDRYDYEADLARIKEGKWKLSRVWHKGVPNEMKPTVENPKLYEWKD